MEEITKKIIEYNTNWFFRNHEYEEQLAEELAIAIMAEFYKNICTSLYNFITFWIYLFLIFQIINYIIKYIDSRETSNPLSLSEIFEYEDF